MGVLAEKYQPKETEAAARALWAARGFPRPDGVVGRSAAPLLHQFEGSLVTGDDAGLVAFRAVAADADARYLALAGRRALGTLRSEGAPEESTVALLRSLSVWSGGASGSPVDGGERRAGIEAILGRMAARGLVATRDTAMRICPSCAQARSPERIIYQQEEGDTYLVRFALPDAEGAVHALVWVDAPWRLLGASALLVSPHLPYVVARYRRRGVDERILTSRPSLSRLLEWMPGGEVEVLEEGPGSRWQGRVYQYPLRHEFPMGGDLSPPSGTVLAVPDVTDSGTGIVPLVPGHGGTDAQIADRLGIAGWPLVTARGQLDFNLAHKYSGLDIPTANEFVARDLGESGSLFARLRVRRGVPHCSVCGTALAWAPGRAWCLEPSRLSADRRDLYRRLLPHDPPVGQVEVASWPVSEPHASPSGASTVTLLECPQCERLEAVGGSLECPCGNRRDPVTRRLLPSIAATLGAWARFDPFPAGDSAWIYLNERRRAPALVHHLAVMSGVPGVPADVGLTLLPGVPEGGVPELVASAGADAVRAALVAGERRERSGPTFPDRCRQEARRLERWWNLARETLDRCDPSMLATFAQPIAGSLPELEAEDRAILARWERVRLAALADYDHQSAGAAYRRVAGFLANDLEAYRARVRPRLERSGTPPSRRAALRTLHHLLREGAVVLAPVAPHIAEAVFAALVPGRTSLFEASIDPLDSGLLNEAAIHSWDRWRSLESALDRFRRRAQIPAGTMLPSVVAVAPTDELAASLQGDRATLQRLTHVTRFEAFGPSTPWTGRQRSMEPVLAEIQRAYPQEASQILHVLRRMPARRRAEGANADELSVVVRGLSRKILPSMVEYVERLPEHVLATPWAVGELYIELPPHQIAPIRNPPPVSADAFRLIARVERELRRSSGGTSAERGPVVIAALDPLASELRASARALAEFFQVPEVRVVDASAEFPRARCLFGRTRTGVHWWVRLSGDNLRGPRAKHRPERPRLTRVRTHRPGAASISGEVDFASESVIAREEEIRTLVQELDGVLGVPLLGPAKVTGAWAAGFRSATDFANAPFDRIQKLPGFGGPIAESLVRRLGGTVPPRLPREVRLPADDTAPPLPPRVSLPVPDPVAETRDAMPPAVSDVGPSSSTRQTAVAPTRPPDVAKLETPPGVVRASASSMGPGTPTPSSPVQPPPSAPAIVDPPALPPAAVPTTIVAVDVTSPNAPDPSPVPTQPEIALLQVSEPTSQALKAHLEPASGASEISDAADGSEQIEWPSNTPPPPAAEDEPSTTDGPPPSNLEVPTPAIEAVAPSTLNPTEGSGVVSAQEPAPSTQVVETSSGLPEEPMGPVAPLADSPMEAGPEPNTEVPVEVTPAEPPVSPEAGSEAESSNPTPEPRPESLPIDVPVGSTGPEEPASPAADGAAEPPPEPGPDALPTGEAERPSSTDPDVVPSTTEPAPDPPALPDPTAGSGSSEATLEATPSPSPELDVAPDGGSAELLEAGASGGSSDLPSQPTPEVGPPVPSPVEPDEAVTPPPTEPLPVPLPPPTPSGGITLTIAPSYLPAFARFLEATAAGHRGVCVVRESPDRLRAHVGPRPVEIYWLSNLGRGLTLRPNDLDAYSAFLVKAVEEDRVTAVFLEGIEYLARVHGTERVLERLAAVNVAAQGRNARVWVYLHPDLIPAADLARFVATFGESPPPD